MDQNWTGLGPIKLVSAAGDTKLFPCLTTAITHIRRYHLIAVNQLKVDLAHKLTTLQFWHQRRVMVIDELGLIVPLWKINEISQQIETQKTLMPRFMRYSLPVTYRQDPVPYTGIRRRRGDCFRKMKTSSERRDLIGLEMDQVDLDGYPVRVKIRARRKNLPSVYDDICIGRRGRSWKHHRRTQYKE